ncbi:MAG TPA: hypothetical protein VHP62_10030 [Usitatibacter sp.]|jgi:hypothetical protein|nr:hypothetical protein [Usitatibacter sp.]
MKNFAAPLLAVFAGSLSLGATAQAITAPQGGFGGLLQLNPDPSVAWVMAAGFLGLVVLRRTRSGPMN